MFNIKIMNDEKKSFDYMWELLNPPREFHNMRSKCETTLWNNLSNPWYAIVNARDAEPTNYNGNPRIDDLAKTMKMVVAWYKERAGIYTLEEALALKLSIIREFQPLKD